jgi:hypothetical protein
MSIHFINNFPILSQLIKRPAGSKTAYLKIATSIEQGQPALASVKSVRQGSILVVLHFLYLEIP